MEKFRVSLLLAILYFSCYGIQCTRQQYADPLPAGPSSPEGNHEHKLVKRQDDEYSDRRRLKTKFVNGVEVLVRDPNDEGDDPARGRDWPLTLSPRIVRDKFAIDVNTAGQIQPTSVIKTEYSTFTYFITSLDGSQTVTSTDIVVSSNVVTETLNKAQATPILQATPLASAIFIPSQNQQDVPSGFQVLATKTYFTTSTYYTTLIDKSRTVTRTRTKVKSSIVTETYSGGQFAEGGNVKPTVLVPGENQVKYLSLGPNIYGKIKTLFATYTYFTTDVLGSVAKSMEVITQVYIIFSGST